MIEVAKHDLGVVLSVRAQPRARTTQVVGEHGGSLKVAVTDPPQKGQANQSIVELIAQELGLKKSQVQLLTGANSRDKRLLLVGQVASDIQARLQRITAKSHT